MSAFPARQSSPGIRLLLLLSTFVSGPSPAGAQMGATDDDPVHPDEAQHPTTDTLWLAELHALALRADPRAEEVGLLERRSQLRSTDIRMGRLPSLSTNASAQYVSQVARIPSFPGSSVEGPERDQYDAHVSVRQSLYDPSMGSRLRVEEAQHALGLADLETTLWRQRLQVNESFFSILLTRERIRSQETALADLRERHRVAAARVEAGAALPSEVALIGAEIIRLEQTIRESGVAIAAEVRVLESLVGRPIPEDVVLAVPLTLPELTPPGVRGSNPEYESFRRQRELLDSRSTAVDARMRPRLSLTLRSGYGRPGLNPLGRAFDGYAAAGVQMEWSPWDRGEGRREKEVHVLERTIVDIREAAFTREQERTLTLERARIESLRQGLTADEEIVALRMEVLEETRRRHDEGEAGAVELIGRLTELLEARLDRDLRHTQLAEAHARYLTTTGREVR